MPIDSLDRYLERLRELPFVRGVAVVEAPNGVALDVRATRGRHRVAVDLKRTHISQEMAARLVASAKPPPRLVLAPHVGRPIADRFEQAGINFMDLAGNCYISLNGGQYIARVRGQRAAVPPTAQKGMRAPAYRALFALLAKPALAAAPIRELSAAAGVSRQAATDIRGRLAEMGIIFKKHRGFGWHPNRVDDAMDLLVSGYATTLRPAMMVDRYRTRDADPAKRELDLMRVLRKGRCHFQWGGGAAADRLIHHYHGPLTVMHVKNPPTDLAARLGALRDPQGPLVVLGYPGPCGEHGETPDTAHPLLVYCELLVEGSDRARETAGLIAERWLGPERLQ